MSLPFREDLYAKEDHVPSNQMLRMYSTSYRLSHYCHLEYRVLFHLVLSYRVRIWIFRSCLPHWTRFWCMSSDRGNSQQQNPCVGRCHPWYDWARLHSPCCSHLFGYGWSFCLYSSHHGSSRSRDSLYCYLPDNGSHRSHTGHLLSCCCMELLQRIEIRKKRKYLLISLKQITG